MFALTIWQPWAELIVRGEKRVENRSWKDGANVPAGTRIAIHAGKVYDDMAVEFITRFHSEPPGKLECVRGAIIGSVVVTGYVYSASATHLDGIDRPWFVGPIGWMLAEPIRLGEPIPIRGGQKLWRVPDDIAEKLS